MDYEFKDGRIFVRRTPEEREPTLKRLRRIEGQVRGLQQMLSDDRHCLDEVQQMSAITAALREVSLIIVSEHLDASVDFAVNNRDGEIATREMIEVLRAALRR